MVLLVIMEFKQKYIKKLILDISPLCHVFNLSFQQGIFPEIIKPLLSFRLGRGQLAKIISVSKNEDSGL